MREKVSAIGAQNLNKIIFVAAVACIMAIVAYIRMSSAGQTSGYGYGYGSPTGSGVANSTAIFRLVNATPFHHFWTVDPFEKNAVVAAGQTLEGSPFRAYNAPPTGAAAGAIPIYRLFNALSGDHLFTKDLVEVISATASAGYTLEGTGYWAFNASEDPASTIFTTALYRLWKSAGKDHFYTTDLAERTTAVNTFGYALEGIGYFVPLN